MKPPNRRAVADAIAGATPTSPPPPPPPPSRLGARFEMKAGGLFRRSGKDDGPDLWGVRRLRGADADTQHRGQRMGLVAALERPGRQRTPRRDTADDVPQRVGRAALAPRRRWPATQSETGRAPGAHRISGLDRATTAALNACTRRLACDGGQRIFVPATHQVFGTAPRKGVPASSTQERPFRKSGTLEGGAVKYRARCVGNSRLVLRFAPALQRPCSACSARMAEEFTPTATRAPERRLSCASLHRCVVARPRMAPPATCAPGAAPATRSRARPPHTRMRCCRSMRSARPTAARSARRPICWPMARKIPHGSRRRLAGTAAISGVVYVERRTTLAAKISEAGKTCAPGWKCA